MQKELHKLFQEYIDYCTYTRRLRPATIQGYKEAFKHFSNLMPSIKKPADITSANMNFFFKKLNDRERVVGKGERRTGVKLSTTMTYWSKLNSFLKWLEVQKYIDKNPLPKMRPAEPDYSDKKDLSKSKIEKIITAIDLHSKNSLLLKRDKVLVYILLYCGLRRGELISLRVMDIDLSKGTILVRGETSKSKKNKTLPLHPALEMHIKDYLKERNRRGYKNEYLFVSNNSDRQLSYDGLKHWVKRVNKLSGVKFHLHQFRHTFACSLARQNVEVIKLQKLMGHTDLRMTQRYLRSMNVEDLRDEVNRLSIDNLV